MMSFKCYFLLGETFLKTHKNNWTFCNSIQCRDGANLAKVTYFRVYLEHIVRDT